MIFRKMNEDECTLSIQYYLKFECSDLDLVGMRTIL